MSPNSSKPTSQDLGQRIVATEEYVSNTTAEIPENPSKVCALIQLSLQRHTLAIPVSALCYVRAIFLFLLPVLFPEILACSSPSPLRYATVAPQLNGNT